MPNKVKLWLQDLDIIIQESPVTRYSCSFNVGQDGFYYTATDLHEKLDILQRKVKRNEFDNLIDESRRIWLKLTDLHNKQYYLVSGIMRISEEECDLFLTFDDGLINLICQYVPKCCNDEKHLDFNQRQTIFNLFEKEMMDLEQSSSSKFDDTNSDIILIPFCYKACFRMNYHLEINHISEILYYSPRVNITNIDINEELERHQIMLDEIDTKYWSNDEHYLEPRNKILHKLCSPFVCRIPCCLIVIILLFACIGYVRYAL